VKSLKFVEIFRFPNVGFISSFVSAHTEWKITQINEQVKALWLFWHGSSVFPHFSLCLLCITEILVPLLVSFPCLGSSPPPKSYSFFRFWVSDYCYLMRNLSFVGSVGLLVEKSLKLLKYLKFFSVSMCRYCIPCPISCKCCIMGELVWIFSWFKATIHDHNLNIKLESDRSNLQSACPV